MKRCPTCQSQFTDDSLSFCLQDGTPLISSNVAQMPTVSYGEQETVVSAKPSNQGYRNTDQQNWQTNPAGYQTSQQTAPPKKSSGLTIFLFALAGILGVGIVAFGAWVFMMKGSPLDNSNLLLAKRDTRDTRTSNTSTIPLPQATPQMNENRQSEMSNTTAPVQIDKEQIKKDVSSRIDNWKSTAESRDLDANMKSYADTVNFYNKNNASRSSVRTTKEKAFTKYNEINIQITNLSITPGADGNSATAVFDKEWRFLNDEQESIGKVKQQLTLKKINGQWLISGEKDLKVYSSEIIKE